jgi:hypothetical protein
MVSGGTCDTVVCEYFQHRSELRETARETGVCDSPAVTSHAPSYECSMTALRTAGTNPGRSRAERSLNRAGYAPVADDDEVRVRGPRGWTG